MDMDESDAPNSDSLNLDESRHNYMDRNEMMNFHQMDSFVYRVSLFPHYHDDQPIPHNHTPLQVAQTHDTCMPQQLETEVFAETPSSHAPSKKRNKRERGTHPRDYEKNICGYITKKVVRQFIGNAYNQQIGQMAEKYGASIEACKGYYYKKIQIVTGPSHLPGLFSLQGGESGSIGRCKRVFRDFYRWFLKHRYLRYLLNEGKMANKQAYIEYKNKNLFKFVEQSENEPQLEQNPSKQAQDKREQTVLSMVRMEQS